MTATLIFETPTVLSLVQRVQDDCAEGELINYANLERTPHRVVNNPLSAEFPGRYVARLWFNRPEMEPTDEVNICPSLDGVQVLLPHDLIRLARDPIDHPVIVMTWA